MKEDLSGMRFGRLYVTGFAYKIKKNKYYSVVCDCGKEKVVARNSLVTGKTTSCGCYLQERRTKHGKSRTRLYKVLRDMKTRCYNENSPDYKHYGAKGIQICEEWLNDFNAFEKWAFENGYNENAPKLQCTIDRINNNGNYEPANCRWVTIAEQNRNKTYIKSKWDKSILGKIKACSSLSRKQVAKELNLKETEVKYILKYFHTTLKTLKESVDNR